MPEMARPIALKMLPTDLTSGGTTISGWIIVPLTITDPGRRNTLSFLGAPVRRIASLSVGKETLPSPCDWISLVSMTSGSIAPDPFRISSRSAMQRNPARFSSLTTKDDKRDAAQSGALVVLGGQGAPGIETDQRRDPCR